MAEEKKIFTAEDVKRLAPGYRGRLENFDPAKAGKKNPKPNTRPKGPRAPEPAKPTHADAPQKITQQRKDPIILDSIFGVDVDVIEIAPRENVCANYSRLPDLAAEIYDSYQPDIPQLDRKLVREEVAYYATAMLWLKLLEVKTKQGEQRLSSAEKEMRKAVADEEFNVPQPLYTYLSQIGSYTDQMGKVTNLDIPPLPTTVAQGYGGYHATEVNVDTHTIFEEVQSLAIAGDMVMCLTQDADEPAPDFRIQKPAGSIFTSNLCGNYSPIVRRRPEIAQRLRGQGITPHHFQNIRQTLGSTENTCYHYRTS